MCIIFKCHILLYVELQFKDSYDDLWYSSAFGMMPNDFTSTALWTVYL